VLLPQGQSLELDRHGQGGTLTTHVKVGSGRLVMEPSLAEAERHGPAGPSQPEEQEARMGSARFRLRAACSLAGPVAFTAAWVAGTQREAGYSVAEEHLSGLAAPDARNPEIMIAGFLALGACTVAFASALEEALGGRGRAGPGPVLMRAAGIGTVAAGLLRRDRMLLHPPGGVTGQSWHNHGHDLASGVLYASLLVAPLLLARRFRGDAEWEALWPPAVATTIGSAMLLGLFWSDTMAQWGGVMVAHPTGAVGRADRPTKHR
jgi:Protein of unknown function (DUF998)